MDLLSLAKFRITKIPNETKLMSRRLGSRIVYPILFSGHRWYGGRAVARCYAISPFQTIWVTNFLLVCMYLRICARSSSLYPTDISRKCAMMVWQMAYHFSWPIQLVIFVSWKATKLSGCWEIYSHQSEIVTECTATINYFEYWLLTGIEINMVRIRPREISRGIKYIARCFTVYNVYDFKSFK